MGKEYEVQVIDVNINSMRSKLKAIGGKKVHKNIKLIRAAFDRCNGKVPGFARVRYEGKNTTMTVKIYNDPKFPDETEVTILEDFEVGKKFLEAIGLNMKAFQETYREKWSLPIKGVHEITFDTWPGLPPWMEIDCSSKQVLDKVVKLLSVDADKISYGASALKYQLYYGISRDIIDEKTASLTFKNIAKEIRPTKNKELFNKFVKLHKKL